LEGKSTITENRKRVGVTYYAMVIIGKSSLPKRKRNENRPRGQEKTDYRQ